MLYELLKKDISSNRLFSQTRHDDAYRGAGRVLENLKFEQEGGPQRQAGPRARPFKRVYHAAGAGAELEAGVARQHEQFADGDAQGG